MTDSVGALATAFVTALPGTGLLFVYALLFAMVEIEIEGKEGWAINLPTWYRRTPWYARAYGWLLSGKPLTGYHAVMFFIPFVGFHVGLVFGQPWSWGIEADVVARYLVWNVTWDFMWFLLNPVFGWRRFRKGEIWWHARWLGRMPLDYVNAIVLSFVVVTVPWLVRGHGQRFLHHAVYVVTMALFVLVGAAAAPLYQRWYAHMRRPGSDERPPAA